MGAKLADRLRRTQMQLRTEPKPRAATTAMTTPYASPAIRDRFLGALDAGDRALSTELAANLISCTNPLPGMACHQLGLPAGSTYGNAARRVLLLYSRP